MNQNDDGYFSDQEQQYEQVREIKPIEDPNPIYSKSTVTEPQTSLKMVQVHKTSQFSYYDNYIPFRLEKKKKEEQEIHCEGQQELNKRMKQESPFADNYSITQLVYQRYNNRKLNRFKDNTYFAGFFVPKNILYDYVRQKSYSLKTMLNQYYNADDNTDASPYRSNHKDSLSFDSQFQSGNLFAAFKTGKYEYDLVMQNDLNSKGSNQWFYFSVENMIPNADYTFKIVNFTKTDSLFNYGMKPAYLSRAESQKNGVTWSRVGRNVSYDRGSIQRENSHRYYYSLRFTVSTRNQNDKVYLAHSYPYTFTQLKSFIDSTLVSNKEKVSKVSIGKTVSGKDLTALVITDKKRDNKKAIIVMARQHPGETQGSYVCEGFIQRLLQKSKENQFMLKNYIFYVIPMVNPDGVIFGHYRTNLAGKDLNRKWDISEKSTICPEVTAIKAYIADISKDNQIRFILDLHGHSKKLNSFFYGNPCVQHPETVRIFPYSCSRVNEAIQYMDCTFASQQNKKKAARVYLSSLYRQIHVYTFQSSFYAYVNREGKRFQFTPKLYAQLGHTLVNVLFMQMDSDVKTTQIQEFNLSKNNPSAMKGKDKKVETTQFMKYFTELKENNILLGVGQELQSGSDSKPEEGEVNEAQMSELAQSVIVARKKTHSTKISQSSKSVSIRITSKKQTNVEYRDMIKPNRNMKFMTISQVNAVLPDKYHISLQPIQKKQIRPQKKDCQTQTEGSEIQSKQFRAREIQQNFEMVGEIDTTIRTTSRSNKNSRLFNSSDKQTLFQPELYENELIIRRKNKTSQRKNRSLFTQTMISVKNVGLKKRSTEQGVKKQPSHHEARIAKMEQINLDILRVYNRRNVSAHLDLSFKNSGNDNAYRAKERPCSIIKKDFLKK